MLPDGGASSRRRVALNPRRACSVSYSDAAAGGLPCCDAPASSTAAPEQEVARFSTGGTDVVVDRLAGVLGDLESNRQAGLILTDCCSIDRISMRSKVLDFERHNIQNAQLAVDREITSPDRARVLYLQQFELPRRAGRNGGFAPISLPLFQAMRSAVKLIGLEWFLSLGSDHLHISPAFLPFWERICTACTGVVSRRIGLRAREPAFFWNFTSKYNCRIS
jgi:hypothetical protein